MWGGVERPDYVELCPHERGARWETCDEVIMVLFFKMLMKFQDQVFWKYLTCSIRNPPENKHFSWFW